MERMVRVIKELRTVHKYNGYIHMKSIPGASKELVTQAGLYADRLSVNIEIPTEKNLKFLAPEKDHKSVFAPMKYIQNGVLEYKEEKKKYKSTPKFTPAGQSTQMIIGATNETDQDILKVSSLLYMQSSMRRVYYSGFIPVNPHDNRLPALQQAPLVRENRLYQADWLMRFYHFTADEIIDDTNPNLDLEVDPKLSWALRHPEMFPVDVNTAEYRQIVRVPGIGIKSAKLIIASRKFGKLDRYQLKKIGVIIKRAQYFITCRDSSGTTINEIKPEFVKKILVNKKHTSQNTNQISLIFP